MLKLTTTPERHHTREQMRRLPQFRSCDWPEHASTARIVVKGIDGLTYSFISQSLSDNSANEFNRSRNRIRPFDWLAFSIDCTTAPVSTPLRNLIRIESICVSVVIACHGCKFTISHGTTRFSYVRTI